MFIFQGIAYFCEQAEKIGGRRGDGVTERFKDKKTTDGETWRESDERIERERVGGTQTAWKAVVIDSTVLIWFN
jgi:hypothetical protein